MHKRKKRKSIRTDASAPPRRGPYPASGALSGTDQQTAAQGSADKEGLSFRVELPSRRWLEQAATNSTAGS
jgi:hypothetical protein